MYTVIFSNASIKALKKLPKEYQLQIKKLSIKLESDPFAIDIKKLSKDYKATHSVRISSYRLFLHIDIESKEVFIAEIKRRTTQTYK